MMRIRLARPRDVAGLIPLYRQLSQNYQDNPSAIDAALKHPATFVYVAVSGGVVIGTATLSVRVVPSAGIAGYVDDVVVDGNSRGQGVARALMEQLIKSAQELECVRLELTSRPERAEAIRLYEKLGFRQRATNPYSLSL